MRVLIYSEAFAPKIGGVETIVMLLAKGLAQNASSPGDGFTEVTVVTHVGADGMDDSQLPFRVVRKPNFTGLVRLLRHAEVIHLAGPCFLPLALGLLLRKPVVVEHHGYQACCPNGLLFFEPSQSPCPGHFMARRYRRCVECRSVSLGRLRSLVALLLSFPRRWFCRKVACNITISDHVARRILLPRSRTIYYGISDSPAMRQTEDSVSRPVHFAYVGRLVAEKGLSVLIGAAKLLKEQGCSFRLTFVGDGPERSRLEFMVDSHGLRSVTTFTGALRGDILEAALQDVGVVVMPSVWEETAGLSAIEHMMRGRAVIASDIGGLTEVVGDAGLKFSPGDTDRLARCMRLIIEHPSSRAELGRRGRERALKLFQTKGMIDAHAALYREITRR